MAKRKRILTVQSANEQWKSGCGQGTGKDYQPWLTIHDLGSDGLSSRSPGWKSQRVHHFLSQGELKVFYWLECCPEIMDIREQYPLWSYENTQKVADSLGIRHPTSTRAKSDAIVVMTSDFHLTAQDGTNFVRTVKTKSDLLKLRTIQKLQIEQQYWLERDVNWKIVIADEIPSQFVINMKFLHSAFTLDEKIVTKDQIAEIADFLTQAVLKKNLPLRDITIQSDKHFKLERHTSLYIVRHLIAKRFWRIDMTTIFNPVNVLELLEVANEYNT